MKKPEQKSSAYKVVNSIFIIAAAVIAIYSIGYLWKVYKSIYSQVGTIKTIICMAFTIEIGLIGLVLLIVPIFMMAEKESNIWKMIKTNILAIIVSISVTEFAFPIWNGIVMMIISSIFK